MKSDEFNKIIDAQIERCRATLIGKAGEYAADDDRLHNFDVAATLKGCNAAQALSGMMAKHTVSVYDMVESGESFSLAKWEEKIGDHLNYLLLLKAIVVDQLLSEPSTPAQTEIAKLAVEPTPKTIARDHTQWNTRFI